MVKGLRKTVSNALFAVPCFTGVMNSLLFPKLILVFSILPVLSYAQAMAMNVAALSCTLKANCILMAG